MLARRNKNEVVSLCDQNDCLGCMACYNACPTKAIKIQENQQKEAIPIIDYNLCISCGKCQNVCPSLRCFSGKKPNKGFACYTKDKMDVITCSSGGVATSLYRSIIKKGGIVVGAVERGIEPPILQLVKQEEQIEEFKGSKYVYVQPGYIYKEVEQELIRGRECLFIGTPCQVDALCCYLNKEYENLYTVDIICHGTPPFEYFHEYIEHISKDEKDIKAYSFRGKYDYYLVLYGNNRIVYKKKYDEDLFFSSFLQGLISREICYKCPYAQEKRVSDMTIGDYWGAPETVLNGYNKGRISAVLINTDKGEKLWNYTSDRLESEETQINAIIQGNNQLRKPSIRHPERDAFLADLAKTGSFISALHLTSIIRDVKKAQIENRALLLPKFVKQKIIKPIVKRLM